MQIQANFSRLPLWLRFAVGSAAALAFVAVLSLMSACQDISVVSNPDAPDFYIAHAQSPNPVWLKSGAANPAPLTIPAVTGASISDIAALRFSGPSDWLYLVSSSANALVILNKVGTAYPLIASVSVGGSPFALAIDGNASYAYVSNTGGNSITVVDLTANVSIATIALPAGSAPKGIAVTPDGAKVFTANSGTATVSIVDTATRTVTGSIPVGTQPTGLAMSPNGHELYVSNTGSNSVTVIDVLSGSVATTITGTTGTRAVAVSGSGTDLFVGQSTPGTGAVALYDTGTVTSNMIPTPTAANPVYLLGIGVGSFLSADQSAARVTQQWVSIGNPVVNNVFTVGESPTSLAVVRGVSRTPVTPKQCVLTTSTLGSGTVAVSPASSNGSYTCGTTVTLTATPAAGNQFTQWSGDLTGSANPSPVLMDRSRDVKATFAPAATVVNLIQSHYPGSSLVTGIGVTVDGTTYSGGHASLTGTAGTTHVHSTTSPQIVLGTEYTFQNWTPSPPPNVATSLSQTVTYSSTNTTYTANFALSGYVVSTYGCGATAIQANHAPTSTNPVVYPVGTTVTIGSAGTPPLKVLMNGVWFDFTTFPASVTLTGPMAVWSACPIQKTTACVAPPAGMTGWWGLDLAGLSTAPDLSGNNNPGNLIGGPAQSAGKVLGSLPSGISYLEVPSSSSLNFGTGSFSADMWVRWSDPTKNQGDSWLLSKYALGHGIDFAVTRALESPGLARLMLRVTDGSVNIAQTEWDSVNPAIPSDNLWHLVAFSYDSTVSVNSRVTFYIDGTAIPTDRFNVLPTESLPKNAQFDVSNTAPLRVGAASNLIPSLSFNGDIDEVEVFNRAITTADLQLLMSADTLGKCKTGASVTHTIATNPLGLLVQIDAAAPQSTPAQVNWAPGTRHLLGAPVPQMNAAGDTQYAKAPTWSPAGPLVDSAPSTSTTYTGTFAATGYKFTLMSSPANCASATLNPPLPASGFYAAGQTVGITAIPAPGFSLAASNTYTGTTTVSGGSLLMTQPQTITINCSQQATVDASYSKTSSGGNIVLTFTNTSSTTATNLRINSVASNTAGIVLQSGAAGPSFPMALGNLAPGASMTRTFTFATTSAGSSINMPFSITAKFQADNMPEVTSVIAAPFPR
jgi:YVTN family beta-propeller protein/autotransporter-associated beta strand protein